MPFAAVVAWPVAVYVSARGASQHGRTYLERAMSRRIAAAPFQFTVAFRFRQGIAPLYRLSTRATLAFFLGI
jgi:hypothetical protein